MPPGFYISWNINYSGYILIFLKATKTGISVKTLISIICNAFPTHYIFLRRSSFSSYAVANVICRPRFPPTSGRRVAFVKIPFSYFVVPVWRNCVVLRFKRYLRGNQVYYLNEIKLLGYFRSDTALSVCNLWEWAFRENK